MKKTIFCLVCVLALCFLTACQNAAPCIHVDADDNGMCDLGCKEKYSDGIDTVCPHKDYNKDNKCDVCKESCAYTRDGEYIYFGEYPQTLQSNDRITYSENPAANGYYLGSDNNYYAKVVADPYGESYYFSNATVVESGKAYYFKVEPIRWRIIETDYNTALIVCDSIIDSMAYDANDNNYKNSDVRAWLCNTFYKEAFTALQQAIIVSTEVDNSGASTADPGNPYICGNTVDPVFLLSYSDVINKDYGFDVTTRQLMLSDYARAGGALMSQDADTYYCGTWWLRSPYDFSEDYARCVYRDGRVLTGSYAETYHDHIGVVPALVIRLK